ncbi:MAG: hypothetical protein ACRD1N_02460 [Terriglobia bacterium]
MSRTTQQGVSASASRREAGSPAVTSQGLDWLWHHLQDLCHPHILDCGPVSPATLQVLLRREAKLYVADLLTPAFGGDAAFWDRTGKVPVFLPAKFLDQLPSLSPSSLAAILSWNLLDLVPHESLAAVMERLISLLQPLGVLFCVLREPYHKEGVERRWWLETLTSVRNETDAKRPCPYPAISNREMERLAPTASIKTFLTRSGRREILVMKQE